MPGDVTKFQDLETQVGGIDWFKKTHKMSTLGLCWRKSQRTVGAVQRHVDKISFSLFKIYVRHTFPQNLKGDISFFLILRIAGQDNKDKVYLHLAVDMLISIFQISHRRTLPVEEAS